MKFKFLVVSVVLFMVSTLVRSQNYHLQKVDGTRLLIDSTLDRVANRSAVLFLDRYKGKVDSVINPVVGHSARYMSTHRPECEISNLLADILVDAGKNYHEHPVLGVYNMGGIRASLPKGVINFGNIIDIAPFENKICFASLRGSDLMDLFRQMASNGGEGVSHGVKLVMNKKFQLLSVTLNGKKINPRKIYRITTIDYIVQGNDGLKAFAKSFDKVEPKDSSNDTRFIIADYFRKNESKGIVVDSNIEGRITVVDK